MALPSERQALRLRLRLRWVRDAVVLVRLLASSLARCTRGWTIRLVCVAGGAALFTALSLAGALVFASSASANVRSARSGRKFFERDYFGKSTRGQRVILAAAAPLPARQYVAHVAAAAGVVLAGTRVLFQQGNRQVDSVVPGGSARLLVRGPGDNTTSGSNDTSTFLAFAASPSLLAVQTQYWQNYHGSLLGEGGSFSFGPLDGPYTQVAAVGGCSFGPAPFAVEGTAVAYLSCVAGPTFAPVPPQIVIHDAGPDAQPDRAIPLPTGLSNVDALAMASGTVAAYLSPPQSTTGEVVVWDSTTGAERYRVPVASADHLLAVQADQTVAFTVVPSGPSSFPGPACVQLAWASLSAPREHDLPGCVLDTAVRLVGGRLAYVAGPPRASALVTTDLAGGDRRTALVLGAVPTGFDFDGTHLVSAQPACDGGVDLELEDASVNARIVLDPRCPGSIPRQRPRIGRGRIRLRIRCPRGCLGRVTVRIDSGSTIGISPVAVSEHQRSHVVAVKLRRGVILLAHGGTLSLRITLSIWRLDHGTTTARRTIVVSAPAAAARTASF